VVAKYGQCGGQEYNGNFLVCFRVDLHLGE
jgi:hypothetical protein